MDALPRNLKDLPRPGARLCLRVLRFMRGIVAGQQVENVLAGPFVIAFSGGADSTALALILHCLGLPVRLAHLDHGLRPESEEEAAAAARFAGRLGVPCLVERADVAGLAQDRASGLEETGRLVRYRFLEQARRRFSAAWIVTGHHLDDLCEDQLLRLIRGTGWPGLGGMVAADADRRLLRPLLGTRREELTAFLASLGLEWIEDASNRDEHFTRNRLRHRLLPLLHAENPAFAESARALWRLAREDEAYWNALLAPVLAQVAAVPRPRAAAFCGPVHAPEGSRALFLPRAAFMRLPRAARLRVYAGLIRRGRDVFGGGQARASTLFRLDEACLAGRGVKRFQLPGALLLISAADGLYLYGTGG